VRDCGRAGAQKIAIAATRYSGHNERILIFITSLAGWYTKEHGTPQQNANRRSEPQRGFAISADPLFRLYRWKRASMICPSLFTWDPRNFVREFSARPQRGEFRHER
jgi:hypothetical protein